MHLHASMSWLSACPYAKTSKLVHFISRYIRIAFSLHRVVDESTPPSQTKFRSSCSLLSFLLTLSSLWRVRAQHSALQNKSLEIFRFAALSMRVEPRLLTVPQLCIHTYVIARIITGVSAPGFSMKLNHGNSYELLGERERERVSER